MSVITKSGLRYSYRWTELPRHIPFATQKLELLNFNCSEGYEMLSVINKFMEIYNLRSIETAWKIEELLHNKLPNRTLSYEELWAWIKFHLI